MALRARVVALGGGGFSMEPRNLRLDAWLLSLTGRRTPRVLFVPTASGDSARYVARFHRAFARLPCRPAHLDLFRRREPRLERVVLVQDLIYVGGGNTANMLAIWRLHGVDALLGEAAARGTVLCGVSAGAICWFDAGVTDSFGTRLAPLAGGLGLLEGSFCPHYDGEPARRPAFCKLVAAGQLPPGFAADDGAALLFEDGRVAEVVSSRRRARGWRVERGPAGVLETPLDARLLPAALPRRRATLQGPRG